MNSLHDTDWGYAIPEGHDNPDAEQPVCVVLLLHRLPWSGSAWS